MLRSLPDSPSPLPEREQAPDGTIAAYSWIFPGGSPVGSTFANPGVVTFANSGTYVASLTVSDNAGLSDPSPPTRTITVSPDFSVAASPSSQTVTEGGSTSYTVTVTALPGFTGSIALSVAGLPAGTTGSFSPATIATSGTSTLTVATAASTPAGGSTLTITGVSGSLTHSTSAILDVSTSGSSTNVISIDFLGIGTLMASSEVAGVVPESNWNIATGAKSSSPLGLVNNTGNATTATVTWTSDDIWDEPITDAPGNVRMMKGYLDNGNQDTTTVSVNGLPSNPSGFNVYVYVDGSSSNTSNTGIYQISGAGITTTSATLTYNSNFSGTFTQATAGSPIGNYVVLTIPNVSGFTLSAIPSTASTVATSELRLMVSRSYRSFHRIRISHYQLPQAHRR